MNCKYCNRNIHISQIRKHEKSCYLNPKNIKYCPVCGKIVKNFNRSNTCSRNCSNLFYSHKRKCFGIKTAVCIKCNKPVDIDIQSSCKNFICEDCKNNIYYCKTCNKKIISKVKRLFCNRTCMYEDPVIKQKILDGLKKGTKNSSKKQNRRSKAEIEFAEYCEETFLNVKLNAPMFNGWDADIILPDYKIAILWNGPWHYEKLFNSHSLSQTINRDKIKLNEIKKMGYVPYIIKDNNTGKKDFVLNKFIEFLKFFDSIVEI